MPKVRKRPKRPDSLLMILIIVKVVLITLFALGLFHISSTFSNSMTLLAVNENNNGEIVGGSSVLLSLRIEPGSGNVYTSLNTFEEIDTQVSLINSHKIACKLFNLRCEKYDFYYSFDGTAQILRGPSASSAIAVITAKTVNRVKVDESTVITGALNSGGVIGNVGGIEEKIVVAKQEGFSKVLIPTFSEYNITGEEGIAVVKVIDIIDVYNNFNGRSYTLQTEEIDSTQYDALMKSLSDMMCLRSFELQSLLDEEETNLTNEYRNQGNESFTSASQALEQQNFYSAGSFCYNANINYRTALLFEEEIDRKELNEQLEILRDRIVIKRLDLQSFSYLRSLETLNDFYVYLITVDRTEEALELIETALEETPRIITENETINTDLLKEELEESLLTKKRLYATALERFYTVELWERMLVHSGTPIKLSKDRVELACSQINKELTIKLQLLQALDINLFGEDYVKQLRLEEFRGNKYLCIYDGLELTGRVNTILNSVGIGNNESSLYASELRDLVESRLSQNANGEFPLIPSLYHEYSGDLLEQDDVASSLLYSNYALAYTDLNLFLEKEQKRFAFFDALITNLFNNVIFVSAFLVLLAFMS